MGESRTELAVRIEEAVTAMAVDTLGGRIQVSWDSQASATPFGQLAFFAEFLQVTGVFDQWVADSPLAYTSGNAPDKRDVLGTWLLSVLAGQRRYAHVTGLRGDGVSPRVLGLSRLVSEDALRRALLRIPQSEGTAWMRKHVLASVAPALGTPWILDIDTTIKTLYGRQEAAEVGYNPKKPGRPSHAYHSYWVGNLRLVLDVDVSAGDAHASSHALPGLMRLLDELPHAQRPHLVRGDCGFGNDPVLKAMEARRQGYLFKLRQSPNVQRLLLRQFGRADWCNVGQGWEAVEDQLRLSGWDHARRVVILRRPLKQELAVARKRGKQIDLDFTGAHAGVAVYEYAVLVTDCTHDVVAIAQLYRDRADAENGFDELKNQWGWGGFTTQDLARCQLTARTVALVYNWWSWYARLAHPKARLEAITSRPLLLAAIGRAVQHAGQYRLYLTPLHAAADRITGMIANIREGLQHVRHAAEQLTSRSRWQALIAYILEKIIGPWCRPTLLLASPETG